MHLENKAIIRPHEAKAEILKDTIMITLKHGDAQYGKIWGKQHDAAAEMYCIASGYSMQKQRMDDNWSGVLFFPSIEDSTKQ